MKVPVLLLMSLLCCISAVAAAAFGGGNNGTDREALLELKKQITGDPLGVLSSWNGSTHYCQWFGVECGRRHQRVTMLNLGSQQLSGRIAPAIGNLSFLRELRLRNNSFSKEIPSEIGRLRRLELLYLHNNSLSGQIPRNISQCASLHELRLGVNQLAGEIPSDFGSLSNLKIMYLHTNFLTGGIPASLGNLTFLEKLFISHNPLSGTIPDSLGRLKNLDFMAMEENRLSGSIPSSIFNLSLLTGLYLSVNLLEGGLTPDMFITLPLLHVVTLFENKHLTGLIPISISNASNLISFNIVNNEFTGKVPSFQNLKRLTLLGLSDNSLGTGGLDGDDDLSLLCSLRNSTNLQYLSIASNKFGGTLPNCIANLSVHLESFEFSDNFITGRLPNGIRNLVSLSWLALQSNQILGTLPDSIGALSQMKILLLAENKFSGEIPDSLGNLTSLISLRLGSNNLRGRIPPSIGNLQSLTELNLSHNSLSGTLPPQLMTFPLSLLYLDLSGNHLTGSVPPEVGKLMNLEELYFANNRLSGEIPSSIGSCTSLQILNLSHNFLQGAIPSTFVSLKVMVELDLSHNNLSGEVPIFLGSFIYFLSLNLSYNDLEGTLPVEGVFKNTSAISVMGNKGLCGGIPELKLPRCELRKKRKVSLKLILLITIGVAILLVVGLNILVLSLLFFLWRRKRNKLASGPPGQSLLSVSYQSLLKATNDFSSTNLVGVGHFGSVYKGTLDHFEAPVAVKILNPLCRGAFKSFTTECEALKSIRHRNLVKILTVCSSIDYQGGDFKALVYDFMANGSLEEWLHPSEQEDVEIADLAPARKLGFLARINIAIDVASALEYLHIHCQPPIAHCDVKPSNILLDEDMTAHVGDFGIARIFQEATTIEIAANQSNSSSMGIRGTIGYAPPEYGVGSQVSTTGDVYSFGILLLEMFTGKRPTENTFNECSTLRSFVKDALPENVRAVSDPTMLRDEISQMTRTQNAAAFEDCLNMIFEVGIACSATVPKERRGMDVVVAELIRIRNKFVKQSGARLA